jgi:hypothetical protein
VGTWRSRPGLTVSAAAHVGLLAFALFFAGSSKKFQDAPETVAVDVVTDQQFAQMMKGEKAAREIRMAPRVDRVADTHEAKEKPALAETKRDIPAPPPPLKRLADPGEDEEKPTPTPPKRVAAAPPPARETPPAPPREAPAPPAAKRPAPAPEEKDAPQDAEIVKPKPPQKPKPEKAESAEKPKPEAKPAKPRLKVDEVAKLLKQKDADAAKGEAADAPQKGAKPKSGDPSEQKSKFNSDEVAKLLSREAPERKASTGVEKTHVASVGAPEANAPKLSANMAARIGRYIQDHYQQCWHDALSMGKSNYTPIVSFKLTRTGALEGRPALENPAGDPVGKARGEQALQAIRECSPMPIPPEFAPFYEEALHEVEIRMRDMN